MTRRSTRRFVAAIVAMVLVAGGGTFARAATTPKVTPLVLQSQTPWVDNGGTFSVRISSPPQQEDAPSDLEYAVSIHPASPTRSAFLRTLSARPTTSPLAVITTAFSEATSDASGAVTLDVGVQDPAQPRDRTRVAIHSAGVYPVVVELRTVGGSVHARLLTHLIFQPGSPNGPRLAVGTVVPVRAPVALRPSGVDRLNAADASAIAAVGTTLATLPSDGVLLDPSPETLAALGRGQRVVDRAALNALQAIALTHTLIDEPFVPTQTPEAASADRAESERRGRQVISDALGAAPSTDVRVLVQPNDARLDEDLPARVVIANDLLQSATQRVTTAAPVPLRRANSRTTVTALIGDADLAAYFSNDESPVLSAHHLLADLATIYFDNPGRTRSIVVVPAATWRPNAALLAPFLAGLESSPILEAASVDRLFTPAPAASRTRIVQAPPTPPSPPGAFASVRRTIVSFRSVLADSPEVAQSFTDRLLISESAGISANQRRTYVDGLSRALSDERHKFLLPSGGSLTLTARRGGIPVTVRTTTGYTARVVLQVASDRLKFPGGATKSLSLTRRDTTTRFTVQSQGSGAIPLRILLKSPDGHLVLASSRLTIRSTNVSGVGIALSVGALLFLLVWWRRHYKRGKAPRPA